MAIQLKTDTNRCSFISLLFSFFFLSVFLDAAFENVGLSARPMGMGGSYTALAEGTNAIAWNPAGLVGLSRPELGLNYYEIHGLVNYSFISLTIPIQSDRGIGFGLLSSSDLEELYQELVFDISIAQKIWKTFQIGLNCEFLSSSASIGEIQVGSGRGIALDIGARYTMLKNQVAIGLNLPSLISRINYSRRKLKNAEAKSYHEVLNRGLCIGMAIQLGLLSEKMSGGTLAIDYANGTPLIGLEYLVQNANIQLGYRFTDGITRGPTMGFGYQLNSFRVDYAYVDGKYSTSTSVFSVTIRDLRF